MGRSSLFGKIIAISSPLTMRTAYESWAGGWGVSEILAGENQPKFGRFAAHSAEPCERFYIGPARPARCAPPFQALEIEHESWLLVAWFRAAYFTVGQRLEKPVLLHWLVESCCETLDSRI